MGKKDKKKGKGAEKAQAKALKKASKKEEGLDELEALIKTYQEQDAKANTVAETAMEQPPSQRSHCTFVAHCEKDLLVLFGGEYFDGKSTEMFNEVILYNIKKDSWSKLFVPHGPAPRSGHASAVSPQGGGQIWIHGGEFSSKNGEQFYHYKDFWCLSLDGKKSTWEEVKVKGAPSARSGHRMVYFQKQLIVFGGFHESVKNYVYFSDVLSFDLIGKTWTTLKAAGQAPSGRSGVQMGAVNSGIFICGGFSKLKASKDADKGQIHSDAFMLTFDSGKKAWKWEKAKQGGEKPEARSGTAMTSVSDHRVVAFGGADDEDNDDDLASEFSDQMHFYDSKTNRWFVANVNSKDGDAKRRPGPRMNAQMTVKGGQLYLYGGILEQGERSYTLNDLWTIDVKKLDKWKQLVVCEGMDWQGSDDEAESESENESEDESSDDEPAPAPRKKLKPSHPDPFHAELEPEFQQRTKGYWMELLLDTMDEEEAEEAGDDELQTQAEELASKWYKKSVKARIGVAE